MRILALLACVLLSACGAGSLPSGCGLGPATALPVQMQGHAAVVAVTINQRRANLIVDTGANITVINHPAAEILGVERIGGPPSAFIAVGGAGGGESGRIPGMQIGALKLASMRVIISGDTPADGVLGLDVLSRYQVEMDLSHGRIVLHPGSLCTGQMPPIPGPVLEIPAVRGIVRGSGSRRVVDPYLMVPVSLDGAKTLAALDSGALAGSLASTAFAASAGVSASMLAADVPTQVRGFGTATPLRQHRFTQLTVGREVFRNATMLVGGDPAAIFPVILGADYFLHHIVWFDFAADRIFVVPLPP